jgi:S-(hydroxymethyl)glutathione dehydrogenase / alcohol dehydrogenase
MKIKAAVLYKANQPLVIETDIEVPRLGRGQILAKIFYSGICHSQLMEARGKRGEDRYLPHLLGHEATAEVIDTGTDVSKVKKGDRVILTWIKSEGIEAGGTKYNRGGNIINAGAITTFSEYSVVSENRCVKLPAGIPLDIGSLFGCAVQTGGGIITNTIQPKENSTLAIFGVGGIGLSALMAANLYNCSMVIAVDVEEDKLNMARKFGATHIINSMKSDPVSAILKLTSGTGLDYAVDASGLVGPIEQAFQSVRKGGGLCVFATHPAHNDKIRIDPFDLICGKQIKGSWGGDSKPDRDIPRFAKLYLDGKLPLEKLITRRYSLDQINEALLDIENRKITRALLEITKE